MYQHSIGGITTTLFQKLEYLCVLVYFVFHYIVNNHKCKEAKSDLVLASQIITYWMSLNEWKSTKCTKWDTSHDYIFICLIFGISESGQLSIPSFGEKISRKTHLRDQTDYHCVVELQLTIP
uniref:Uncharacterized protein n=1 Tax=Glossina pallidipes TaxID=7398 RepID=A0A1A9Z544_GLOPL